MKYERATTDPTVPSSRHESNVDDAPDDASPCSRNTDAAVTPTLAVPTRRSLDRAEWWQKSLVRRSVPAIRERVQEKMEASAFFQREPLVDTTRIALFHRREIQTGRLLGTGGFSEVYEITGFVLDVTVSERCTPAQQRLRHEYAAAAVLGRNGRGRYALKHLKSRLLQRSAPPARTFARAATDLVLEAMYMSRLHHRYILAVRGLPMDDVAAWNSGDCDGYFLITDRLDGTLGNRIKQWKQDSTESPGLLEKVRYAQQLASALHYLHSEHRIVFRDLKPQNMGFAAESNDELQLFDFGLCRELPPAAANAESRLEDVYTMSSWHPKPLSRPDTIPKWMCTVGPWSRGNS
jgi:serine/threonine protein kinase